MKSFTYKITDELGIHARPAGLLIKEAKKFNSESTIEVGEKSADLKKLFAVMGLGIKKGNDVKITANGDDEDQAVEALEAFLQANL